jgi:hypothetical protein
MFSPIKIAYSAVDEFNEIKIRKYKSKRTTTNDWDLPAPKYAILWGLTCIKWNSRRCLIFIDAKDCMDLSFPVDGFWGGSPGTAVLGLCGLLECGFAGESAGGGAVPGVEIERTGGGGGY